MPQLRAASSDDAPGLVPPVRGRPQARPQGRAADDAQAACYAAVGRRSASAHGAGPMPSRPAPAAERQGAEPPSPRDAAAAYAAVGWAATSSAPTTAVPSPTAAADRAQPAGGSTRRRSTAAGPVADGARRPACRSGRTLALGAAGSAGRALPAQAHRWFWFDCQNHTTLPGGAWPAAVQSLFRALERKEPVGPESFFLWLFYHNGRADEFPRWSNSWFGLTQNPAQLFYFVALVAAVHGRAPHVTSHEDRVVAARCLARGLGVDRDVRSAALLMQQVPQAVRGRTYLNVYLAGSTVGAAALVRDASVFADSPFETAASRGLCLGPGATVADAIWQAGRAELLVPFLRRLRSRGDLVRVMPLATLPAVEAHPLLQNEVLQTLIRLDALP